MSSLRVTESAPFVPVFFPRVSDLALSLSLMPLPLVLACVVSMHLSRSLSVASLVSLLTSKAENFSHRAIRSRKMGSRGGLEGRRRGEREQAKKNRNQFVCSCPSCSPLSLEFLNHSSFKSTPSC